MRCGDGSPRVLADGPDGHFFTFSIWRRPICLCRLNLHVLRFRGDDVLRRGGGMTAAAILVPVDGY